MNMTGVPWIGLTALEPQRCHQLAWFIYGWIEREHVLNMNACADWWIQAFMPAASDGLGTRQSTRARSRGAPGVEREASNAGSAFAP